MLLLLLTIIEGVVSSTLHMKKKPHMDIRSGTSIRDFGSFKNQSDVHMINHCAKAHGLHT
jgi:hypothetical protein